MKEITKVTIRQDADEPRLSARIYRGEKLDEFYVRLERDGLSSSMPMKLSVSTFKDAKDGAATLLQLTRGMFRQALGRKPYLPEHLAAMEDEIPAFAQSVAAGDFLGQN
jgi:hypothetical protein